MEFLVIGNGSIGNRHSNNLRELNHNVYSYSYRQRSLLNKNYRQKLKLKGWEEFLNKDIDAVIIANTTNLHLDVAIEAAKKGKHIYIEKPLSTSFKDISILEELVNQENIKVDTGFMLRSHPNLIWLKRFIQDNDFGDLIYLKAQVGQDLRNWRENYNYKQRYCNDKNLGGGVVFDLIHELDLIQWIGGEVEELSSILFSHPSLGIKTETVAQISMKLKNNGLAQVHMDYHRPTFARKLEICFEKLVLRWDFKVGEIYSEDKDGFIKLENKVPKCFSRNDLFKDHMIHFISTIKDRSKKPRSSLNAGINALKLALATHASSNLKKHINLNQFKYY